MKPHCRSCSARKALNRHRHRPFTSYRMIFSLCSRSLLLYFLSLLLRSVQFVFLSSLRLTRVILQLSSLQSAAEPISIACTHLAIAIEVSEQQWHQK